MSAVRPFRRRSALQQRSLHFGPNMTPMVDVVMVLLVFFMASAAFVGPEWFLKGLVARKAPPPPTPGAGVVPPAADLRPRPLEITLENGEGGVVVASGLRKSQVTIAEVLEALRVFCEGVDLTKVEVVIRPGPGVAMQEVVRLHEGCERLGLQRVGYGLSSER
ncbi:MAG: biopolymer transporter ExbD [Phycisphaerales bacterium]